MRGLDRKTTPDPPWWRIAGFIVGFAGVVLLIIMLIVSLVELLA